MSQSIAQPENMNAPSNNIIVIKLVHIFPDKFVMFPQPESMHMEFRASSEHVCFSARVFEFVFGKYLDCNGIDSVVFLICEVYNDFFKAVIRVAIKDD